jgi:dihydroorotase
VPPPQTTRSAAPSLHLRGGHLIDPRHGVDAELDVIVHDGRVARVGPSLATPTGAVPVDCRGLVVCPGFIDLHAHLREPGEEGKESIESGGRAALAGGFTAVCCMPNTKPPNDSRAITHLILSRAREVALARVHPIGALSKGLAGEQLAEYGELKDAGVVALSDDGRPIMNARLMRRALEYARGFGLTVIQHCEDLHLSEGGVMNEGASATRAGLPGQPAEAEDVMVARDLILAELTGARYHVAHASTARTVELVRAAKRKGLPVTCEVTPHHLLLTDRACLGYDTSTKMYPPLRTDRDVEALRAGLADGTVDCIATDHAPHGPNEKHCEFDCAAFGTVGLETALPVALALVEAGLMTLSAAVERLTWGAARTLSLPGGTIPEGAVADVCVFDPNEEWIVGDDTLSSKSRNSAFAGMRMKGRAVLTLVGGEPRFDRRGVLS